MKNFFLSVLTITFLGCGGNTNKTTATDSVNAIGGPSIEDTQISPRPDGYATPNAKVNTSESKKDSLDTTKH